LFILSTSFLTKSPFIFTVITLGICNCLRAYSNSPTLLFAQYDLRLSSRLILSPIYISSTGDFTGTTFIAGFVDAARFLAGGSSSGLNIFSTSVDFALKRLLTGDSSGGLNVLSIGGLDAPSTSVDFDLFRLLTGGGLSFANSILFSSAFDLPSVFYLSFVLLLLI